MRAMSVTINIQCLIAYKLLNKDNSFIKISNAININTKHEKTIYAEFSPWCLLVVKTTRCLQDAFRGPLAKIFSHFLILEYTVRTMLPIVN